MRAAARGPDVRGACAGCLRRSWLLATLSAPLDYRGRDRARLLELLALTDEELLQAIGGRRKEALAARHADFSPEEIPRVDDVDALCRHDLRYPVALRHAGAPRMLYLTGGADRLGELTRAPVVALVGSRRASDYGMEMAKSLARGLAACGITIASGLNDGIEVAAQAGALEVHAGSVAVMPGGLNVTCPAKRRSLLERVKRNGCAVAELPCDSPARRWGQPAGERIVAALAQLTVVVEAEENTRELAGAWLARAMGRIVAAVPGRVTSPLSGGTHALLMGGARLVRDPADALELLYGETMPQRVGAAPTHEALEPRLRSVLESVGAGRDTPEKLVHGGASAGEVLLALSELELLGLLARGDGGRYVPRGPRRA
ncbi:MAG: DNA-protecting protein DprA [Actinomycetota bacterium]|nr:DNA-protecting protein DprA [Actinomycetota bacterium]